VRQLTVLVPKGKGQRVVELAAPFNPLNVAHLESTRDGEQWDMVMLHVSNGEAGPLLEELESIDQLHVSLQPVEAFPMSPPVSQVPDQIRDVTPRSAMEIWLNGLQSIGSWKGFLGYALAAAIVVWIGMFTNTIYLLVAAMLIAPFGGPAMNAALASASGDTMLLGRTLLRYFASLLFTIAVSAALSLIMQQSTPSTTMVSISELSSVAVLLPLIAGGAGALTLSQAQNSSLVSGTAPGLLIAASLSPPAGLIGMAGALGRWDMAFNGVFTLILQLLAINLAGALVFRAYGQNPSGSRYRRGKPYVSYASLIISAVALGGLLFYQFSSSPALQRSTRAQRAVAVAQTVVNNSGDAVLVEANMRFTRPSQGSQETLLGVIYARRAEETTLSNEEISQSLTQAISAELLRQGFNVAPVLSVNVLDPPPEEP
jgi:uncharacterized membrane protein